jgi:uncharacterized membrane protein
MLVRMRAPESGLGKARLETLVDGTAAIVLTLLVLDVHVPRVDEPAQLPAALWAMRTSVFTFFVSVLVVGTFWLGHAHQMNFVTRVDRTLAWINIVGLGIVAFIPFTTALLGQDLGWPLPTALYGANLAALGVVGWVHWRWATRRAHVLRPGIPPEAVADVRRRIELGTATALAGIVVALIVPWLAMLLYAAAFVPFAVRGRFDDHLQPHA